MTLFLRSQTQKSNEILNFYFILINFFIKKFTVKLKVKNKTSKKFKNGISFFFTLSIFTASLFNSQFNTAVRLQK